MEIIFSSAAKADLIQIGDYIAFDNPRRALTFVDELELQCFKLSAFPRAHALIPGHESTGIRHAAYGRYLIFYHISEKAIDILRILNGAIDYEPILFDDPGQTS